MDFTLFSDIIMEKLQEALGKEYIVRVGTIEKNRGVSKKIVEIRKKNSGISAAIGLEEVYTKCKTVQDAEVCADKLIQAYKEQKERQEEVENEMNDIRNWQKIKKQVYPMLVSQEKNQSMLTHLYHFPVLDLAVAFYVRMSNKAGESTVKVNNHLFASWNVSEEEFLATVGENMRADGYEIIDMEKFLGDTWGVKDTDRKKVHGKMAIMLNGERYLGAIGMLDKSLLSEYAEKMETNLIILPSSIHETLLIGDDESVPVEMLNEMISQINESCVDETEILSDHAYYYDRVNKEIKIAE